MEEATGTSYIEERSPCLALNTDCIIIFKKGETDMGDKGKKDKGKKEHQKKAKLNPKEKRKLKREKKNK
jgi:hypothetical protein